MKLKSLAVITLLVIGCSFASAQSFGFLSYTGGLEYCNYEQMTVSGFYVQGFDNLSPCGINTPATIEGFVISVPASAGAPVHGKNAAYADNLIDALYYYYTGEQWAVLSNLKAPAKLKAGKYNWAGYIGFSGYEFLGNFGFLTTTIPGKGAAASHKTVIGNVKNRLHKK